MKRKVVGLLLALAFATCMGACSDQGPEGEGGESIPAATVAEQGAGKESGESASKSDKEDEGQKDEETKKGDDLDLKQLAGRPLWGSYDKKLYGFDSSGTGIQTYLWEDVCESLKKKGFDLKDASIMAMSDGIAYCYLYEAVGQGYQINVFAVDLEAKDVTKVWSVEPGWNVDNMDFYKDTLYVTYYRYEDAGGISEREKVFAKKSGKLEYQEKESLSQDFYRSIKGFNTLFLTMSAGEGRGSGCSMTRILDRCGYVIGWQDDRYKMIDADGMVKIMSSMPDSYSYIDSYDENYVIYHGYDDDWNSILNVLDCKTGQTITVDGDAEFLDYADGKLYYAINESEEFILQKNCVYELDLGKGETNKLYEMATVPGATDVSPGTSWFQIIGGKLFFQKVDGNACKWFRVDLDGSKATFQDMNCVVSEIGVFQYGQVLHDSVTIKCKFCGIPLEKYYGEAFQINAQYSAEYQKINEFLAKALENSVQDYYDSEGYPQTDEDCEEHQEYPQMYCETVEDYVSGVRIFQDRYLAVDTNGYWYGGGVHGQPYIGQFLFDLTTGERKQLKDFYHGTEEEFKTLVARKTKEDFESYSEYESPYYSDDADEIYRSAYEYADFDFTQVIFEEDGVTVVYQPYEMGPYASGFIEVWISYEELLGRKGL